MSEVIAEVKCGSNAYLVQLRVQVIAPLVTYIRCSDFEFPDSFRDEASMPKK